jgi:hypothetical protein
VTRNGELDNWDLVLDYLHMKSNKKDEFGAKVMMEKKLLGNEKVDKNTLDDLQRRDVINLVHEALCEKYNLVVKPEVGGSESLVEKDEGSCRGSSQQGIVKREPDSEFDGVERIAELLAQKALGMLPVKKVEVEEASPTKASVQPTKEEKNWKSKLAIKKVDEYILAHKGGRGKRQIKPPQFHNEHYSNLKPDILRETIKKKASKDINYKSLNFKVEFGSY